jgi:predicted alpha/beta-fold hydrolase
MIGYSAPRFLFNAHLETIYPTLFRKVRLRGYQRERITLDDGDFLDLDWLKGGSEKLVIISHGLEGSAHRSYMKGMAKAFFESGFDVIAWNFRGCSGEVNKSLRFYHSGATDDLAQVVDHALSKGYKNLFLIGFSLGGNLTLKFVGERQLNERIKGVTVFSVPLDLHTSCVQISKPSNWIYSHRFLRNLKQKVKEKGKLRKDLGPTASIKLIISWTSMITILPHYMDSKTQLNTIASVAQSIF